MTVKYIFVKWNLKMYCLKKKFYFCFHRKQDVMNSFQVKMGWDLIEGKLLNIDRRYILAKIIADHSCTWPLSIFSQGLHKSSAFYNQEEVAWRTILKFSKYCLLIFFYLRGVDYIWLMVSPSCIFTTSNKPYVRSTQIINQSHEYFQFISFYEFINEFLMCIQYNPFSDMKLVNTFCHCLGFFFVLLTMSLCHAENFQFHEVLVNLSAYTIGISKDFFKGWKSSIYS